MRPIAAAVLVLLLLAAFGCASPRPTVVLLSDFGTKDDAVSLMRGAVLAVARDAQVLDLTHEVPPFDIDAGARLLEDAPGVYPPGTVFVAVVDPGVGTARRPIAARLRNGSWLVGPDNGVLSLAIAKHGAAAVRAIEDPRFTRAERSTTFHGRDVFAPAAGHLARGEPPFEEIGPLVSDFVQVAREPVVLRAGGLEARVVNVDEPFGNLWTDIEPADLAKLPGKGALAFVIGDAKTGVVVPLARTFGDVPEGRPLAYWNSRGRLSLAINMGSAAKAFGAERGTRVRVERAP